MRDIARKRNMTTNIDMINEILESALDEISFRNLLSDNEKRDLRLAIKDYLDYDVEEYKLTPEHQGDCDNRVYEGYKWRN